MEYQRILLMYAQIENGVVEKIGNWDKLLVLLAIR